MSSTETLPLSIILNPEDRKFPEFSLTKLLHSVFDPTEGCRICIITDFEEPSQEIRGFEFLQSPEKFAVQVKAYEEFFCKLKDGVMKELGMSGGEMFAYHATNGSNLDMKDECFGVDGSILSLDQNIYPEYDIILCISDWSATAPLTAKCKDFGSVSYTHLTLPTILLE